MKKILSSAIAALAITAAADAVIIDFDLIGTAGAGLLAANEPSLVNPSIASGGEIGAGIFYNTDTNLLTLNIGWGSSQGPFNDLNIPSTASHIHGPVASVNGNGFTETAGVLINLGRSSNAITGGVFSPSTVTIGSEALETDLLNGKMYVNIHTAGVGGNAGGELRGFLVQAVPEPATAGLLAFGALALLRTRRSCA